MPPRNHDLTKATERAEKYSDILQKHNGHPPLAGWGFSTTAPLGHITPLPAAAAAGQALAAYKSDAVEAMGEQLNSLSLAHRENLELQKETNKSITSLIEHLSREPRQQTHLQDYRSRSRTPPPPQQYYGRPYPSPNRQFGDQQRSPRYSMGWSPNRGYRGNNNGQNYHQNSTNYNTKLQLRQQRQLCPRFPKLQGPRLSIGI